MLLVALVGALLVAAAPARAVQTKFGYSPKVQVFKPPDVPGTKGLTWTVSIVAGGAAGGRSGPSSDLPRHREGVSIRGTGPFGPGDKILIYTGARGEDSNSHNMECSAPGSARRFTCHYAYGGVTAGGRGGGGAGGSSLEGGYSGAGGGGATIVTVIQSGHPLDLLIAAGGGGDGGSWAPNRDDQRVGAGGSGGQAGSSGTSPDGHPVAGDGGSPPDGFHGGTGGHGGAADHPGGTTTSLDSAGNPCMPTTCAYYSPETAVGSAQYLGAELGSELRGGNGGPGYAYEAGPEAEGGGGGGGGGGDFGGGGGGGGAVFWSSCSYPCTAGERTEAGSGSGGAGGSSSTRLFKDRGFGRARCCSGYVEIQSLTYVFVNQLSFATSSFAPAASGGSIARACARGTRVRYRDARAAGTTFTVLRRSGARLIEVGSFTHKDRAGANDFRFTGRVAGHALSPGSYELRATPRYRGVPGTPVSAAFRIVGC